MRNLLASVCALALLVPACTTETTDPSGGGTTTSKKPTTGKTKHPGSTNTGGEHGAAPPADDPTGTATPPDDGDAITVATWDTGQSLAKNAYIPAGQTLTISPGATINVSAGVTLTVKGTLKVAGSATAAHAQLKGTTWAGLIIADGGTLDTDGLDLIGATSAIWTQPGNLNADFKDGKIDAPTPFKMEPGSKLSVTDSTVINATDGSSIAGTFTATNMKYAKGTESGLILNDPAGTMTILNSTLTGGGSGDYVISDTGKEVVVKQTSIAGSHCAFHFDNVGSFTIDHVEESDNGVGGMFYGSTTGGTITASNFRDNKEKDLDFGANKNGPIKLEGTFVKLTSPPANVTATNAATTPIATAGPTGN